MASVATGSVTRRTFFAKVDLSGAKLVDIDFRSGLKREQIIA
jgi:hypothetical protein